MSNLKTSRRDFFKTSALGMVGAMPAMVGSCTGAASKEEKLYDVVIPDFQDIAPDGKPLKAGVVGCGNRGTGAALNFLDAGNGLEIAALGDVFEDNLNTCRLNLKAKGHEVAAQNCFAGFDAYKKVIDSGVDVVLLCTPPLFRPEHFDYAISKDKHCFIEKPCAVDPTGVRQVLVTHKSAMQKGLSVVTGTVLRSSRDIAETFRRVANGAIGEIISVHITRFGGMLWYKLRQPGWSDMEYILRNYINFCRPSGDFMVDMFVHEIDILSWFLNEKLPVRAEATGGRQRHLTGDIYDNVSITYVYDNGMRAHCTSRVISGCRESIVCNFYGTKGYADARNSRIYARDGSVAWQPEKPQTEVPNMYVQEHIRFVNSIRTGKPVFEAEILANSTLTAIMGREAAYTGKFITWDEIKASTQKLSLDKYEFGPIPGFSEDIPLAGTEPAV